MFDHLDGARLLVLLLAALFILGPERLPSAASWLARTLRQMKNHATGAHEQLRHELGPEFDELRKPLHELRSLAHSHSTSGIQPFDAYAPHDRRTDHSPAPPNPNSSPPQQAQSQHGGRPPYDPEAT